MKFEELCNQLPAKRRSVDDLVRFVGTRTDDNPNYSLLLGAGCSVTSGIRSAGALIAAWRKEICSKLPGGLTAAGESEEAQRHFLKSHHSDWYDPNKEYACLFERRYDLQRQRRMFVESEVSKGFPSIGYLYLTALVAQSYFRNIFTTNFDDLLNEAFYLYSTERPIVCAHDSSINSITVTSKRPKIIKLHGDYLFDDLKATLRETESLEQNMKAKFAEFCKEAGFIVLGYSGSDRSIMDVLHSILKTEDYLRSGIYWCLRPDSEIPEELRRLFWKDRVYYVEVGGFDEVFAELYSKFNRGDILPDSAVTTAKRPNQLAERLIESDSAIPETTEILKKAKEKLSKQLKRSAIAHLMVQSDGDERLSVQGQLQDLTDDELLVLTEADNLITDGKYEQGIEQTRKALAGKPSTRLKRRLLRIQIAAFQMTGNQASAKQVADELISLNPKLASNYLQKARIVTDLSQKLASIEKAVDVEPYSARAVLEKARYYINRSAEQLGQKRLESLQEAEGLLERAIELDPSDRNYAYVELLNVIGAQEANKAKSEPRQRQILAMLDKQDPESGPALTCLVTLAVSTEAEEDYKAALQRLSAVESRYGLEDCLWIVPLEMKLYSAHRKDDVIRGRVDLLEKLGLLTREPEVAASISKAIRERFGDESRAERILQESLRDRDFNGNVLRGLFRQCLDLNRLQTAAELLSRWASKLLPRYEYQMRCDLAEAQGKFEEALRLVREWGELSGATDSSHELYILVCAKRFKDAEKLARSILDPISFSPDAIIQIVNYEIATIGANRGKKVDVQRLEKVLNFASDKGTKAGIYALLDRRAEMLNSLREAASRDKTFKYTVKRWPVFEHVRSDNEVAQILV